MAFIKRTGLQETMASNSLDAVVVKEAETGKDVKESVEKRLEEITDDNTPVRKFYPHIVRELIVSHIQDYRPELTDKQIKDIDDKLQEEFPPHSLVNAYEIDFVLDGLEVERLLEKREELETDIIYSQNPTTAATARLKEAKAYIAKFLSEKEEFEVYDSIYQDEYVLYILGQLKIALEKITLPKNWSDTDPEY